MINLNKWLGNKPQERERFRNQAEGFHFSKVKKIGFLLDSVNKTHLESAQRIAHYWEKTETSFLIKKEDNEPESTTVLAQYLNKKSFNWLGQIKSPQVQSFLNQEYDLIVDLTNEDLELFQKLYPKLKVKLLVGTRESKEFDLCIPVGLSKLEEFENQLLKYLKLIDN